MVWTVNGTVLVRNGIYKYGTEWCGIVRYGIGTVRCDTLGIFVSGSGHARLVPPTFSRSAVKEVSGFWCFFSRLLKIGVVFVGQENTLLKKNRRFGKKKMNSFYFILLFFRCGFKNTCFIFIFLPLVSQRPLGLSCRFVVRSLTLKSAKAGRFWEKNRLKHVGASICTHAVSLRTACPDCFRSLLKATTVYYGNPV